MNHSNSPRKLSMALLLGACLTMAHADNVILFIGDGMGFEQVKAARCYNGGLLSFEDPAFFPYQGQCMTRSANSSITDSAAAATAIATGVKVNNDVISVALPGDGSELQTSLEYHKLQRKKVGLITTAFLTHATPAGFGAHEPSRSNYNQIGGDLLNQTRPHLLFGGGDNGLTPQTTAAAGYVVATDTAGFQSLLFTGELLSAQFGTGYMPYEEDYLTGVYPYPHLSEMVAKALWELEDHPDGFFLMVEAGRIDHACHSNLLPEAVHETLELSRTVQVALDWANGRNDTLIIVTADHETGGLTVVQDNGPLAYPAVTWTSGDHTAANVPIYAAGKNAQLVGGIMDNTDIHTLCTLEPDTLPPTISEVAAVNVSATSATIAWTTDEPADSLVEYWTEGDKPPHPYVFIEESVTSHALNLAGLTPEVTYQYQVVSADLAGNLSAPAVGSFTTSYDAYATQNPVVVSGSVSGGNFSATHASDGIVQILAENTNPTKTTMEITYTLHTEATPAQVTGLALHLDVDSGIWDDPWQVSIWNGLNWESLPNAPSGPMILNPTGAPAGYIDADGNLWVSFTDGAKIKREAVDNLSIDLLYAEISVGEPPANHPPAAQDDNANTSVATYVHINVLANDSDPDGDTLTVTEVSQPSNGQASIATGGLVTYTPSSEFTGTDSFGYTISDGRGGTATATVTVEVSSPPPPSGNYIYVYSISMSLTSAGKNYKAVAEVLVHDQDNNPIAGATVYGDYSYNGTAQSSAQAITDTLGVAILTSAPNKASIGDTFTFVVTDIGLAGYEYSPDQNVETSDSISR